MKRTLNIIRIILANLLLIIFSIIFHYRITDKIIGKAEYEYEIVSIISVFLLIICLAFLFSKKRLRNYSIGISLLITFGFSFFVFFINNNITSEGTYKSYEVKNAFFENHSYYLKFYNNSRNNLIKVSQEKCVDIDSVQIRVDNGFFGIKTITNKTRIVKGIDCNHNNIKNNDLETGQFLARKRCFSAAIYHYTLFLNNNISNKRCYYDRGIAYQILNEYENAIVDFLTLSLLEKNEIVDLKSYRKELTKKLHSRDFKHILEVIDSEKDFHLKKRLISCIEKI